MAAARSREVIKNFPIIIKYLQFSAARQYTFIICFRHNFPHVDKLSVSNNRKEYVLTSIDWQKSDFRCLLFLIYSNIPTHKHDEFDLLNTLHESDELKNFHIA